MADMSIDRVETTTKKKRKDCRSMRFTLRRNSETSDRCARENSSRKREKENDSGGREMKMSAKNQAASEKKDGREWDEILPGEEGGEMRV